MRNDHGHSLPGLRGSGPCPYCRGPMAGDAEHCSRPECATRHRMVLSAALARAQTDADQEWLRITRRRVRPVLREAARRAGHKTLRSVAHGIAPYIDVPVEPLDPARRAAFAAHLEGIVDESFAQAPDPAGPESDPGYARRLAEEAPEPAALDASCIACQGDCCLQGGARMAFLKAKHIDYYRWRNPKADRVAILEDYLSRIPQASVSGSCVYHGDRGCVMPRHLRAGICNSFQCRYRATLAEELKKKPGAGAVVAGISHDHTEDRRAGAPYLRTVAVSDSGDITVHEDLRLPAMRSPKGSSEP